MLGQGCPPAEPNQIKDGRPITILPALYRISMKAVTHSILLHLSSKLPPQVAGGLPHRDSELSLTSKIFSTDSPAHNLPHLCWTSVFRNLWLGNGSFSLASSNARSLCKGITASLNALCAECRKAIPYRSLPRSWWARSFYT